MTLSSQSIRPEIDKTGWSETSVTPVDEDGNQEGGGGHAREADQRGGEVREEEQDQADGSAEGDNPRCLPCPGNPTKEERLAHELTHWPYRPWCEWCVRGRAVGPNAKSIPADKRAALIPKAHMDYAFLQDEVIEEESEMGQEEAVKKSMTIMVMVETLCGSVWAYATRGKGYASDPWLPRKIHNDLTTAGMGATHISLKTDNEPAILEVRREVSKCRGDVPTGLDDSRVGDSNSNGKVERNVREVKGLIRTLRADLQDKLKEPIDLDSPVVPWMVRHAGYILTRCRVLECGRTALHRMKGQKSHRPIIPFGEVVMFKIPKTKRRLGDFEDRFEKGVWLGMTVQSGENIVATSDAVYRVGGVMRRAPDDLQ